jgi:hypothetical protein
LLARRRSSTARDGRAPLRIRELAAVLEASYSSTPGEGGVLRRPVPSGGALYPLDLYVLALRVDEVEPATLHYDPFRHRLELCAALDPGELRAAVVDTAVVDAAAAVVVVTAMFWRCPVQVRRAGLQVRATRGRARGSERGARSHRTSAAGTAGWRLLRPTAGRARWRGRTGRSERVRTRTWERCLSAAIGAWARIGAWTALALALGLALVPARPATRVAWPLAVALGAAGGFALFAAVTRRRPFLSGAVRPRAVMLARLGFLGLWATNEEVIWRRVALGELLPRGIVAALAASTVGFALAHPTRRWLHLGTGSAFGGLYLVTGALAASIAAHWVYNVLVGGLDDRGRARSEVPP